MKTVDKYQFNEDTPVIQDGIKTYLAIHKFLKKKFILKMVSLDSGQKNENNYYLNKQCNILKKITYENVYKCHKLLKSTHNFYGIFDFNEGKSLEEVLRAEIAFDNKTTIFKQLIQLLLQLKSKNIVSLNISPRNIVVQDNYKIVFKNFGKAEEFENNQKEKVVQKDKIDLGEYTPPQVNQGKIYRNSDIYSLGVLIRALFANQFRKMENIKNRVTFNIDKFGINLNMSIEDIKRLESSLINRQPKERPDLKETLVVKKNFLTVSRDRSERFSASKSTEKNQLKIPDQKERRGLGMSRSTSNLLITELKERQKVQNFEKLLEIILKKRGLTVLLLKLSEAILHNKQSHLNLSIQLAFILAKKATITISQLAKLLSKKFNAQYIINDVNYQMFIKNQTFTQFLDLSIQEMKSTQQKFQQMLPLAKKMMQFSTNQNLQAQTRNQNVNEEYLKKTILQFLLQLRLINTDTYASQFHADSIYFIYVISLISDFKSLQEMYDVFFSQEVVEIKQQPFYKQLVYLPKSKIVQLIQKNTTKLYSQTQASFDMSVKTTKTTKSFRTAKSYQQ